MGFDAARVDWALKATKGKGLQIAMDHLVEHSEQPIPSVQEQEADDQDGGDEEGLLEVGSTANVSDGQTLSPSGFGLISLDLIQSIKCTDCGKQFRSQAYAQFHAEKSGHTNFEESTEEIKPLTEEEKRQKLEEMRRKLQEKRATQSVQEKEDAKANEVVSETRSTLNVLN